MMMNERKHIRLGDVIVTNTASYSLKEKWSYVNYLDTGNITDNSIAEIQLIDLNTEKLPSRARRKVKYNSIVYSTVRPNQRHFGIIKELPENFLVSTGFVVIDVYQEMIDADYLYFWLSQDSIVELLHVIAEQSVSTYPSIKASDIENLEIDLPPIEEQKKIASVLLGLIRKMAYNIAINDNLYQQLDTIYRATYPYLPSDELPAGWNCVPLGTLCDSISIKHSFDKEKLVFLNTGDVENGHFLHSAYSLVQEMPGQAKKSIKTNDILYSEIRPINRHFAFVNFQADDYVVSTKLMVIRSREMDSRRLYHFLTTQDVINELQIEAESRSGTFPQIRFENIQRLPIIIASPDIELQFTQILKDYYNMIDSNICENQHLATLRDSILPKLMSGEIDVSELDI